MEDKTLNWWYCDNIVHPQHKNQIGLLHMAEPMVFILVRDYGNIDPGDFNTFKKHIEVSCMSDYDREIYNKMENQVLIDAYNFLSLQEAEEDRIATDFLNEDLDI